MSPMKVGEWVVLVAIVGMGLIRLLPPPALENTISYAILFVKPHALHAEPLVDAYVASSPLRVLRKSVVASSARIIDMHYLDISRCAAVPPKGPLSEEREEEFRRTFGVAFAEAGVVGVWKAIESLGVSVAEFNRLLSESEGRAGAKRAKLAAGCFAQEVIIPGENRVGGDGRLIVVNAFYPKMREEYAAPGSSIILYEVSWGTDFLPWSAFRTHIVGATNPATASVRSIRNMLLKNFVEAGYDGPPTPSTNGVHGSASPLEALRERWVWTGVLPEDDPYGAELLVALAGIPLPVEPSAWIVNTLYSNPLVGGSTLFDRVEGLDPRACSDVILELARQAAIQ